MIHINNIIEEINDVKFELSSVKSNLNKYNSETLKDSWGDDGSEEFIFKIQDLCGIINEIDEELELLKTCWSTTENGELQ